MPLFSFHDFNDQRNDLELRFSYVVTPRINHVTLEFEHVQLMVRNEELDTQIRRDVLGLEHIFRVTEILLVLFFVKWEL